MPRHRVREIAAVAGLSEATVDRILHERGTQRASSREAVRAAIAQLDRQQAAAESGARKLSIEGIVIDDPLRARLIRDALHEVRPRLRPHVVHTFVRTVPLGRPDLAASALAAMHSRRPQGVLVDLEGDPAVVDQAVSLMKAGIPVVTLNRSFPLQASIGHSGLDNTAAGATAAYLIARSQPVGDFAVAHGGTVTRVEQDRVAAFVATMGQLHPSAQVTSFALQDAVTIDLREHDGVYVADEQAAGTATFPQLRDQMRPTATIVGHRDADLLPQIATQVFDFALDVSWEEVVSEACRAVLAYHRQGPGQLVVAPTPPSVLTPYNLEF